VVDRHVVQVRIGKIREYVELLRRIRGLASEAQFVKDPLIYGNAERYPHVDGRLPQHSRSRVSRD